MDIEPDIANEISKLIDKYNEAKKEADDEYKDDIVIEDYIKDKKLLKIFNDSKPYQNIIEQGKCHACGFMLFNGNPRQKDVVGYGDIRYEIGLIRCFSESTGKSTIVANIEGGLLDAYGYVKDDFLIVDVVGIIDKLYTAAGFEKVPSVTELRKMVTDDEATWDMYAKGYTCCLNQCERASTTKKAMRFKPKNIRELAAFIAGIRPSFKSLIEGFINRIDYTNNEPAIDELLEDSFHYMLYQEAIMRIFTYLGIPMKDSYDTIKKISKKKLKGEALEKVKNTMKEHWLEKIGNLDNFEAVYKVVYDSAKYGFNSPHALAMANDSLYEAWIKAHYTSVFYEVTLNHYQQKSDKDKVAALLKEAVDKFGYKVGKYKYGTDNSKFTVYDESKIIYPDLASVKTFGVKAVQDIYEISKHGYTNILDVYGAIKGTNINKTVFRKLVMINYFEEFGYRKKIMQMLDIYDDWYGRKKVKKSEVDSSIPIEKFANGLTSKGVEAKQWTLTDCQGLIRYLCDQIPEEEYSVPSIIKEQIKILGYTDYVDKTLDSRYIVITDYDDTYSPKFNAYCLKNGQKCEMKIHKKKGRDKAVKVSFAQLPVEEGDVIYMTSCKKQQRVRKENNKWVPVEGVFDWWINDYKKVEKI